MKQKLIYGFKKKKEKKNTTQQHNGKIDSVPHMKEPKICLSIA